MRKLIRGETSVSMARLRNTLTKVAQAAFRQLCSAGAAARGARVRPGQTTWHMAGAGYWVSVGLPAHTRDMGLRDERKKRS